MTLPVRTILPSVIGAALASGMVAGAAEAQGSECSFYIPNPPPVHLAPGETGSSRAVVGIETNAPVEGLPPYQWRLGTSRLVSAAADRGTVQFLLWDDGRLRDEGVGVFAAPIDLDFTAGQRPGSEHVTLLVFSTDEAAVPPTCRRAEVRVPVAVGGEYSLTASHAVDGAMTTVGQWLGTFSVVDGNRIQGDGTITTTLTGSCVSGTGSNPMRITGNVVDDHFHLTVVGEQDDSEPETQMEESLQCAVRTLTELPSFFEAWGRQASIVMNDPCPLRVPVDEHAVSEECAGVTFHVRRVGGR